jgi:hypothetical protein
MSAGNTVSVRRASQIATVTDAASKRRAAAEMAASKHRAAELAVVRDRHDRDNVLHGRARVTFTVYSKYETSILGQSIEDIRVPPEHPEGGCLNNMTPIYNNFQLSWDIRHCISVTGAPPYFTWEKNRCHFEAASFTVFICYLNLQNLAEQDLFRLQYPQVTDVFERMLNGKLDNFSGKQHLWKLWNGVNCVDFHNGGVVSTSYTFDHLFSNLQHQKNSHRSDNQCLFSWSKSTSTICSNASCSESSLLNVDYDQDEFVLLGYHSTTEAAINVTIQEIINQLWTKQSHRNVYQQTCLICGEPNKLIRSCLKPPVILLIPIPQNLVHQCHIHHVDPVVVFVDVSYTLSCVIYGNGSHFVSRFMFNGKAYHGDGLKRLSANKKYQCTDCLELDVNTIPFPDKIPNTSYVINDLIYIKTECLHFYT